MAAPGDDETPLIYSTQTAATIADLEMEDDNRESNTCRLPGQGTELTVSTQGLVLLHLHLVSQNQQMFYWDK